MTSTTRHHQAIAGKQIAIIGGGPAGLMAAEVLSAVDNLQVTLFDHMPSVGRKLLIAGRGGLNLTHAEPLPQFLNRYGKRTPSIAPMIEAFPPAALRAWAAGLGIDTFVGTSQRVFPTDMKAAPLLRAWLHRLRQQGVRFAVRHRWEGWDPAGQLRFSTPDGPLMLKPDATLLALGGGSWAKLGSDGRWVDILNTAALPVTPLRPANCGFEVAWREHFRERFAGEALKNVAARCGEDSRRGEFVITRDGVEGSLIYALSARLRDTLEANGQAFLELDLLPDRSEAAVRDALAQPRGRDSWSNHLRRRLGLQGVKAALLRECLSPEDLQAADRLAAGIKRLAVPLLRPRPLDEAISTAGGVPFEALDARLMLLARPGVFCAGEMLDWEAPTGGYLLSACLASGRTAAAGMLDWLTRSNATT